MIKGIHNKTQERIFDVVVKLSFVLMIASSLGVSAYAPSYSQELKSIINLYISLVLLWRFNPLRNRVKFSSLDRKIAFSAGVFMLTTTFLNKYIEMAESYGINAYDKLKKRL